jgi:hypothetical protein
MAMTYFLPIVDCHSDARPVIGRLLARVALIILLQTVSAACRYV